MKFFKLYLSIVLVFVLLPSCKAPRKEASEKTIEQVKRFDREGSSILKGVKVPAGNGLYFASGIVAEPKNPDLPEGDRARFGNTYDQSVSALKRIDAYLSEEGLGLQDVIAMKVYVAPDPLNENKPDFEGWFQAYAEYFNHMDNPNKVARSTVGVYQLVDPNKFIEIEVRAVYPVQ